MIFNRKEWHEGIGGRKPARLFTPRERGRVKQLYSRRKVFWDVVAPLVQAGTLAPAAVDMVYTSYGRNLPVTAVLRQMAVDRRQRRDLPNLRVAVH